MSTDGDAAAPHEVVIVRRRGGEGDDGHHGGAWKIAFADLMTAMMAFFLVMWLLNVSDKEKIQQIATYFNPLKLNSKRPTVKGVEEEKETDQKAPETSGKETKGSFVQTEDKDKHLGATRPSGGDGDLTEGTALKAEEELFNDPYGVLARIAAKVDAQSQSDQAADVSKSDNTLPGGDAYSNPFSPFGGAPSPEVKRPKSAQSEHEQLTISEPGTHPLPPGVDKPLEIKPDLEEDGPPDATVAKQAGPEQGPSTADKDKDKASQQASALEHQIAKALEKIAPTKRPNIEVRKVDEGVLISLTDDFKFGMFEISSAEPKPETVVVMEKVAGILGSYDGRIVLRGHTDARQFRTERNNNWRLSTARAQAAYYMLVRGGIPEQRFQSIEGRADRDLKVPADPHAAENRRIEIMLRPAS